MKNQKVLVRYFQCLIVIGGMIGRSCNQQINRINNVKKDDATTYGLKLTPKFTTKEC